MFAAVMAVILVLALSLAWTLLTWYQAWGLWPTNWYWLAIGFIGSFFFSMLSAKVMKDFYRACGVKQD
jgi:hypothetical protein